METLEEPPLQNLADEAVKVNVVNCEVSSEVETSVQSDVCHKTNGIADSQDSDQVEPCVDDNSIPDEEHVSNEINEEKMNTDIVVNIPETTDADVTVKENTDKVTKEDTPTETEKQDDIDPKTENDEDMQPGDVEVDGIVETVSDNVRFETEIFIETNVDDQTSKFKGIYGDTDEPDHTNTILSELGQNIELSEVLRSSDVTENAENNNCDVQQEVFNKEELLDILEGNDVDESRKAVSENFSTDCKKLETQLALQQLSRLKQDRKSRHTPKKSDKKSSKKSESPKEESVKRRSNTPKEDNNSQTNSDSIVEPKKDSIVHALVKDWEDDETSESNQTKTLIEESENLLGESDELVKSQEATVNESNLSNAETSMSDGQTPKPIKCDSEMQPQQLSRRESYRGRVIKKKVIFDPDNPDTFTKTKVIKKENQDDKDQKDQPTPKKNKTDQTSIRSKSKSPVQSKLQWKKPQPKNIKQNKRLTEIDRLLMDEGAVNMICQLTPEAAKGHKNMKSKAEFIKKIQSSTPDGKEMKFRERKKELKLEEGDAKRVGTGKERLSLSSSVKSPTVSEDFEAHSADDSIIYRRHSSSSYSSPCMSPRRLSDVETINQNALATSQTVTSVAETCVENNVPTGSDVFMADSTGTLTTGVINKSNLLSIKEKLNSKLSLALNKRKRDSTKAEKPSKIKKVSKLSEKPPVVKCEVRKYVRLIIDQKVAEIHIQQAGTVFNIEVMNELKTTLETVESKNDVSVTILTAESGTLCSELELKPLLDQEEGLCYAQEMAESARSLLSTLERHSKLVCATVEDRCYGLGLSLVALSDITVASEKARFELSAYKDAPLQPGAAALTARGLSQSLLNDIIVFERPISAAEALQGGLVSRTVWPEGCLEQARAIAKDIASQPTENVVLKKQLLRLKRGGSDSFLAGLEQERDLFIKYWSSAEGQNLVRASLEAAKE